MAGGAEARDSHPLAFKLLRGSYIWTRDQALQAAIHRRECEHGVCPAQRSTDDRIAAADGKLNLAGEQRAHHPRRTAADKNNFNVSAMLFEQALLLGHPNAARCRADRAQAETDALLSERCTRNDETKQNDRKAEISRTPFHRRPRASRTRLKLFETTRNDGRASRVQAPNATSYFQTLSRKPVCLSSATKELS